MIPPKAKIEPIQQTLAEEPRVEIQTIACPLPATLELNGPKGPEPTRFGDWERKGRCVDF